METVRKDPLGSAWMVIAALGFTVMNLSIKAASTQFGFSSGELVFWRMLVSTLENPSQPQRHRHACHDVHVLFRHAPAAGNRRHAQLHVLHLAGHLFIFHFKRKNYALYPSHFGYGLYRRYPVAQPIFSRRTRICRAGQFGRRRHVWLGIFAGARTLAFGRTGLARGVLFVAYRPDYGRSLEHHHRLASADRVFPALSGRHRHLCHDCTIGHDPRLQGRQEIHRCLAFLPDRRFLRPIRRTAFRR